MEAIYFVLVSLGSFASMYSMICTEHTKCMWNEWDAWGQCQSNVLQTRTRRACCPNDLKSNTIKACLKACDVSHPGNMQMKDYHGHRNCKGIMILHSVSICFNSILKCLYCEHCSIGLFLFLLQYLLQTCNNVT